MRIRSALLTWSPAALYSCPTASPITAGRFQELASLGGLSENEATNPAAKSLSELGDDGAQGPLWPMELLMIDSMAACLFCPEKGTPRWWGIAVVNRWNSTVLLGA